MDLDPEDVQEMDRDRRTAVCVQTITRDCRVVVREGAHHLPPQVCVCEPCSTAWLARPEYVESFDGFLLAQQRRVRGRA